MVHRIKKIKNKIPVSKFRWSANTYRQEQKRNLDVSRLLKGYDLSYEWQDADLKKRSLFDMMGIAAEIHRRQPFSIRSTSCE